MYDTLVNYQTGARLLEQSLTMRSLDHEEIFDTLTSAVWAGAAIRTGNTAADREISLVQLHFTYQQMQNYFDYDLFANPLNPPPGSPLIPILISPHGYFDRQNLYNFDLLLFPMHRLSFRVGYNRNRIIGPALSSVHEGTEALSQSERNNPLNGFRFGADCRVNDKTTISYTQLLHTISAGPPKSQRL